MKDYYKILGIPRYATECVIKKGYRKMALLYHPDKNKAADAEERFKEIGEAHETLIDGLKRIIYDREYDRAQASISQKKYKTFNGCSKEDFSPYCRPGTFPKGFGGPSDSRGSRNYHPFFDFTNFTSPPMQKDPPKQENLYLTLEEMFSGCTKTVKFTKKIFHSETNFVIKTVFLKIVIQKGLKAGTKVTFSKEGDQNFNRIPADVVFIISEEPHKTFKRDGDDLKQSRTFYITQALFDKELKISLITGDTLNLEITNEELKPAFVRTFAGHGMPKRSNVNERGNLIVEFQFDFPSDMIQAAKDILLSEIRDFRKRRVNS